MNAAIGIIRELTRKWSLHQDSRRYTRWIREAEPGNVRRLCEELPALEACAYRPVISLIVPLYETTEPGLRSMIESVRGQTYEGWELCLADDASRSPVVKRVVHEYMDQDERIKFFERPTRGHIAAASNSALSQAFGEFIALLDHDDELHACALERVVQHLNAMPETDLVYTDEDKITERGKRCFPIFKPEWNRTLFMAYNVINHLGVYRKSIVDRIGGFREGYEGSQDYDLALRFIESTEDARIAHIPQVLYHWRATRASVAKNPGTKDYAFVSARKAIQEHYERGGRSVTVGDSAIAILHKVYLDYEEREHPVTLVVALNSVDDMDSRLAHIVENTGYRNYDVVVGATGMPHVEKTNRGIRVVGMDNTGQGFAEFCNRVVDDASGRYLVFLPGDLGIRTHDWLDEMVSMSTVEDAGVVGGKLFSPDGRVASAGIILGAGKGLYAHAWKGLSPESFGYCGRARVIQELSAVTFAGMLTERTLFKTLGGFNTNELRNGGYDVDYCLRAIQDGRKIIWTPFAEFETRIPDLTVAPVTDAGAVTYLSKSWGKRLQDDPHYSPNFDSSDTCYRW